MMVRAFRVGLGVLFSCTLLFLAFGTPASAATGAQQQAAGQLHLLDLICEFENDGFGSDEPYITINDVRVWSGSNVDRGDVEFLDLRFDFSDSIHVELWEDDGGVTGSDDLEGDWWVSAVDVGTGIHTLQDQFGGGSYKLRYEVL
jgi:hypothetical protein